MSPVTVTEPPLKISALVPFIAYIPVPLFVAVELIFTEPEWFTVLLSEYIPTPPIAARLRSIFDPAVVVTTESAAETEYKGRFSTNIPYLFPAVAVVFISPLWVMLIFPFPYPKTAGVSSNVFPPYIPRDSCPSIIIVPAFVVWVPFAEIIPVDLSPDKLITDDELVSICA